MCGLTGVLLYPTHRSAEEWRAITDIATTNLLANEERGRDATGIAVIQTDGRCRIFKQPAPASEIDPTAYVHPLAAAIGNVHIGRRVLVSPCASVRGDEGQPIWVGDEANVQDGVVLHALETWDHGAPVEKNLVTVDGKQYAVYVGERVSLAHQVHVHGPASVGDDTFVGMQSLVFKSQVGQRCVIEPGCLLMGVEIADGRYVPAGSVVKTQVDADALPVITADYALKDMNEGVVHVNTHLADGYNAGNK